ncbi:hypothetical protein ACJJTC_010254 [Scirpophaga incertulas]
MCARPETSKKSTTQRNGQFYCLQNHYLFCTNNKDAPTKGQSRDHKIYGTIISKLSHLGIIRDVVGCAGGEGSAALLACEPPSYMHTALVWMSCSDRGRKIELSSDTVTTTNTTRVMAPVRSFQLVECSDSEREPCLLSDARLVPSVSFFSIIPPITKKRWQQSC